MGKSARTTFKNRLYVLNKRADWLRDRIHTRGDGIDPHHERAEYHAIVWAINLIEDYPELALGMIKGTHLRPPEEGEYDAATERPLVPSV